MGHLRIMQEDPAASPSPEQKGLYRSVLLDGSTPKCKQNTLRIG